MSTGERYTQVGDRLPVLSGDLQRNLAKAAKALSRDRVRAVALVYRGQQAMRPYQNEVARAYVDRNVDKKRPVRLYEFHRLFYSAGALAVLRIGGDLAAWDLFSFDGDGIRVLAGQMVPGFREYRPGRLLEMWLVARARTDPGCRVVDWGDGHAESLLAMA